MGVSHGTFSALKSNFLERKYYLFVVSTQKNITVV